MLLRMVGVGRFRGLWQRCGFRFLLRFHVSLLIGFVLLRVEAFMKPFLANTVRKILNFFMALFVTTLYWGLSRLWLFKHVRFPSVVAYPGPRVYAHWHGDELLLIG